MKIAWLADYGPRERNEMVLTFLFTLTNFDNSEIPEITEIE